MCICQNDEISGMKDDKLSSEKSSFTICGASLLPSRKEKVVRKANWSLSLSVYFFLKVFPDSVGPDLSPQVFSGLCSSTQVDKSH